MLNTLNYNDSLILLPEENFFDMLKNGKLKYSNNQILKDVNGNIIKKEDISDKEYYFEFYINEKNGEIEEIVCIKDKEKAKIFHKKFQDTLDEKNSFELLNIKDNDIPKILEIAFEKDQEIRKKGNDLDPKIDLENLKIAVSILENNKDYLLEKGTKKDFKALFIIILHASLKFQKKYIEFFTELSKNGKLEKSKLALMIDKILLNEGKPQKYGTQYIKNGETGKLELYKIEDLENLNKRRESMELRTIEKEIKKINNNI